MRKKSKYKPRTDRLINPITYAIESQQLLAEHSPDYVVTWKIRNVESFGKLLRGEATHDDLNNLVAMRNVAEAMLVAVGIREDDGTIARSAMALIDICERYNDNVKALRAPEIQALRDVMQLHDELLDAISVKQFENALAYAKKEIRAAKVKPKE